MYTKNHDQICMIPETRCAMDGWMDRQADGRTDGKVTYRGGRPS